MMERYDTRGYKCGGPSNNDCMEKDPEGDYVLYSDAEAVERERDQWRDLCARQGVELKAKERENGEKERTLTEQDETILHLQAALAAAQGDNGKLREVIETMILFIPDGWQMPLGWNRVVAQAQEAIGGKP